jgi:uncharacterized membrane-anchored protein
MKTNHVPMIDGRYWAGITLASIFGTNMGDLYAHESGLGLIGGVPILVVLFALVFVAERFDRFSHDAYYWLCIIIMRTGATNIADYLAGRRGLHIDRMVLSLGLGLLLAAFAWWAATAQRASNEPLRPKTVPNTDARYWLAMLTAGVFGTVLGDLAQNLIGQGPASLALAAVLAVTLLVYRKAFLASVLGYWLTIGVARTAGTAIGDWLAENKTLHIGLPVSTLITGIVFVGVLVLWRTGRPVEPVAAV